jgi:hypothetical protein
MPGTISNHKMKHTNNGKYWNVRHLARFIHLPCITISLALLLVSEIFHSYNKNQTLLVENAYSSVRLQPFVFHHHGCQATSHAILYVTLLVSFLSNTLSTNLVLGQKIPQQFTVSGRKSSNNCTDNLSVYNWCTAFSVHL